MENYRQNMIIAPTINWFHEDFDFPWLDKKLKVCCSLFFICKVSPSSEASDSVKFCSYYLKPDREDDLEDISIYSL